MKIFGIVVFITALAFPVIAQTDNYVFMGAGSTFPDDVLPIF